MVASRPDASVGQVPTITSAFQRTREGRQSESEQRQLIPGAVSCRLRARDVLPPTTDLDAARGLGQGETTGRRGSPLGIVRESGCNHDVVALSGEVFREASEVRTAPCALRPVVGRRDENLETGHDVRRGADLAITRTSSADQARAPSIQIVARRFLTIRRSERFVDPSARRQFSR